MAAGGLGNQIFQVAAAIDANSSEIQMVDVLGNVRKNHAQNSDLSEFSFGVAVNWNLKPRQLVFLRRISSLLLRQSVQGRTISTLILRSSFSRLLIKNYYSLALKQRVNPILATNNGFFDFSSRMTKLKSNFFVGYFQSCYWVLHNDTLQKMRQVELVDNSEITYLLDQKRGISPLCVHIRLGDYRAEPDFGILSFKYYEAALERVFKERDYDQIWLFSDEPHLAIDKIPTKYRERVWVVPILSAAQTLELMRYGQGYIIANSSFSWWGAMLSKFNDPTVVAPDKWFKNLTDPAHLIPPSWIKIESNFEV